MSEELEIVIEQINALIKNCKIPSLDSDQNSLVSFAQRHVLESLARRLEKAFDMEIKLDGGKHD